MGKESSTGVTWKSFSLRFLCVCCLLYVILFVFFKWHLSLRDTSVDHYTQGSAHDLGHSYHQQYQQRKQEQQLGSQERRKLSQRKRQPSLHLKQKSQAKKQQRQGNQQQQQQNQPKQKLKTQQQPQQQQGKDQRQKQQHDKKQQNPKQQQKQQNLKQQQKQQRQQQQPNKQQQLKEQSQQQQLKQSKKQPQQQKQQSEKQPKEQSQQQQQSKKQPKEQSQQQQQSKKQPKEQKQQSEKQQQLKEQSQQQQQKQHSEKQQQLGEQSQQRQQQQQQQQKINIHQKHVAFVKTHKAASSTMLNILYRFAVKHQLMVALPLKGNYIQGQYLSHSKLLPVPKGYTYDLLCNHAIFNYSSYSVFLPKDTVYVGIVREPYRRFISAFHYFKYVAKHKYLQKIPGHPGIAFQNYLANASKYEPPNPLLSMTNNRMVIDFGFPPQHFDKGQRFREYLNHLNKTFALVMVAELFDESLILLKRKLNWGFEDIMYVPKNRARMNTNAYQSLLDANKQNVAKLVALDVKLYKFFYDKLKSEIRLAGGGLQAEVNEFRKVWEKIQSFCVVRRGNDLVKIDIGQSQFSEAFTFRRPDCVFIQLDELHFLGWMTRNRKLDLRRYGVNKKYMESLP